MDEAARDTCISLMDRVDRRSIRRETEKSEKCGSFLGCNPDSSDVRKFGADDERVERPTVQSRIPEGR